MPFEATVAMPYFTGLPEDVIVNTFCFNFTGGAAPVLADFQALEVDLKSFYTAIFHDTAVAGLAPWVNNGNTVFKVYNLNDPVPRPPVYMATSSWPATSSANGQLPPETALCLSFHGTPVAGVNQATRRGRVFIGGLGNCTTVGGVSAFPKPTAALMTGMTNAAIALLSDAAADDWAWVVRSRKAGTFTPVVGGWVDDAFDTQRRRGNSPSARQLWP